MAERVAFTCNRVSVEIDAWPDETLLEALRERIGVLSVKDGCAPQGQCGCCTVLVDGEPRVACVTPLARIAGRAVTTVEGLDPAYRDRVATAFVACGGSQCGFCTPGILMRFAGARPRDVDRSLAAHLCRCTGWLTVRDAIAGRAGGGAARDLEAASRRAALEGGVPQRVGTEVPLGGAPFADDTAPRDALVAVPLPPGSSAASVEAQGMRWVVAESLPAARRAAGKVQGRRTTLPSRPPLADRMPARPPGGVQLATSWVEPAYVEPDASWCVPGGTPASPLANGGAFGGKAHSLAPSVARELADRLGHTVRVAYSREDVVRLGPKRAPIAAVAVARDDIVSIEGVAVAGATSRTWPSPPGIEVRARWTEATVRGPRVSGDLRAAGLAEQAVLVAGALGRDVDVMTPSGARAKAYVAVEGQKVTRVRVEIGAGDPLDEVVLRSYAIGAAHMALGWVLSEALTVDSETGEIYDLTIRSFGVLRAADTPAVEVTIVDTDGPPRAHSSDAVFAAVAASTWNALGCPDTFPVRRTTTESGLAQ